MMDIPNVQHMPMACIMCSHRIQQILYLPFHERINCPEWKIIKNRFLNKQKRGCFQKLSCFQWKDKELQRQMPRQRIRKTDDNKKNTKEKARLPISSSPLTPPKEKRNKRKHLSSTSSSEPLLTEVRHKSKKHSSEISSAPSLTEVHHRSKKHTYGKRNPRKSDTTPETTRATPEKMGPIPEIQILTTTQQIDRMRWKKNSTI